MGHTPVSKIYSQVHVEHTSARVGRIRTMLIAAGSREAQECGGVTRVSMWLLEIDKSNFKPNPKISRRERNAVDVR